MSSAPAKPAKHDARLVGVIHLPPLAGSPLSAMTSDAIAARAVNDAKILYEAGYDLAMIENFGDTPFFRGKVPPITVSAMTACAAAVRREVPNLRVGINVLRNDVEAALAIAVVVGGACVRVNVHTGARVTDQGLVEGEAATTLRSRRALGAESIAIWADVDVKHAAPLAPRPIDDEAKDLYLRGMADVLLVTGKGTGASVDPADLARVRTALPNAPILVASGARETDLARLAEHATGVIVGSALRADGKAGGPIDRVRTVAFAAAFRAAFAR
ncbi:MAG: photosystem biosis protein BtpA [Myxococcaceae bacterium]|nr:photosystem biosis protein BtpA [Myxococcaceae bacterium]